MDQDSLVRVGDLEKLGYVKLSQEELSQDDRISLAMIKALFEVRNPKEISREELCEGVISACYDIGIKNVIVTANDRKKNRWFVDDLVREERYRRFPRYKDNKVMIGYFLKDIDKGFYTAGSFNYNSWAFSDEKAGKFFDALRERKVKPHTYIPFGTVFSTDEQIKAWNERKPLYQ